MRNVGFKDIAFGGSANGGYCEVISGAYIANLSTGMPTTLTPEILCVATGSVGLGFGTSLAIDGDLNGDSICDLVVGQPAGGVGSGGGSVYIYLGSNSTCAVYSPIVVASLTPNPNGFGGSIAISKDLSGDAIDDLLVCSPLGGRLTGFAYVSASTAPMTLFDTGNPGPTVGNFATSVVGLDDIDNDGTNEFAVGMPGCGIPGEVKVMKLVAIGNPGVVTTLAALPGPYIDSHFGRDITVGSFDGDSRPDLVIGAPSRSLLCAVPLSSQVQLRTLASSVFSNIAALSISSIPNEELGRSVANAGDLNADGRDDIIMGTSNNEARILFGPCITGGQQNSPLAAMDIAIPGNPNFPLTTPYCVPVPIGSTIQLQCTGPANSSVLFLTGAANVRAAVLPYVGSLDVGTPNLLSDLLVVPGWALDPGGFLSVSVTMPFDRGIQLPIQAGIMQLTPYPPVVLTAAWYLNLR